MVTPDHDNGVVRVFALFQRVEQYAQAIVGVTHTGEIGAVRLLMHVVFIGHRNRPSGLKMGFPSFRTMSSRSSRMKGAARSRPADTDQKFLWTYHARCGFRNANRHEKRLSIKVAFELIGRP